MPRRFVIIESPYAGDIKANIDYACWACRDSYERGEIPYASHLLYPQFLDDSIEIERKDGMNFGYFMWQLTDTIVFYTDLGWSNGMLQALKSVVNTQPGRTARLRSIYHKTQPRMPEPVPNFLYDALIAGFTFQVDIG